MKFTFITIGIISIVSVLFLLHAGMFASVEINEKEIGPFVITYQEHVGAYSEVGTTMDEIYQKLLDDSIETMRGIGIYYDNPKEVNESELRSEVGSIIEEDDKVKLEQVKDKYNIKLIDKQNSLVIELPYRSKLSIIVGALKAYPAFTKYCEENNCKMGVMFEIYDQPNKKIQYIQPLEPNVEYGKSIVKEHPSYEIEKVLDKICNDNSDCLLPGEYGLRSNCPYEVQCLDNKCVVICPTPEPLIGGQRDEHGCLGPAGYSWDETIKACTRQWEIKEENDIQIAKLAVEEIETEDGLTIISVTKDDSTDCVNCFEVKLDKSGQRYIVYIENKEVKKIRKTD